MATERKNIEFVIKQNMSAAITRKTISGREMLIVPVILMPTECVMNQALYPAAVTVASTPLWNGRPVIVYHPEKNADGSQRSANNPETFERQTIGQLFNCRVENSKQKADAYIDVAKAKTLPMGRIVLRNLENNIEMDVSTGLGSAMIEEEGVLGGKSYTERIIDILPDHLAILPDKKGAASWSDGAGIPRLNADNNINDDNEPSNKEAHMRKELIDKLIKAGVFTENQRKELEDMDEAGFNKVKAIGDKLSGEITARENAESAKTKAENERDAALAAKTESDRKLKENEAGGSATVTKLSPELQATVDWAKRKETEERAGLITKIKENEKQPFSDADLNGMSIDMLEKNAKFLASSRPGDFGGLGIQDGTRENAADAPVASAARMVKREEPKKQ